MDGKAKRFNKAMGAVIRRLRMAQGLSQEKVGKHLGVVAQQVHRYEAGINNLDAHYIPKLAALFGVTVADLYEHAGIEATAKSTPADDDAFMAAHYVRKMSEPVRAALLPYLQRIVYTKGKAA